MSSFNSITMRRTLAVSNGRVWSFMTDINQMTAYFPFIKSSFGDDVRLDTIRVSVVHWDDLYGTFRERCVEWEPKRSMRWRVEEDSMRIFPPDFTWSFDVVATGESQSILNLTVEYRVRNRIIDFFERYRLRNMLRTALDNIQFKLR